VDCPLRNGGLKDIFTLFLEQLRVTSTSDIPDDLSQGSSREFDWCGWRDCYPSW
jgi:hypothetical protein